MKPRYAGVSQSLALLGGTPVRTRPFASWPVFGAEEEQGLLRALHSGNWGRHDGTEVGQFERRFAAMHGAKHGLGVVNGSVSLRVALMAAGIQSEDEVIVPAYSFLATATAVVEANAVPVFADIDLETFNLDPGSVEDAVTPRTRGVIPVHMAGQIADMDAITAIARRHGLVVIEDAAHAHAASSRQGHAGSIGHLGSFSFQSSKNLTSGEGGILITSDDVLAEACRSIHDCGRLTGGLWYEHHVMSGNYRMGEFQGAILNAQLGRLEDQTMVREANGQRLAARIGTIPGIHPQRRPADCVRHSYHLFLFRIDPEVFGARREAVVQALQAEGVPASVGYVLPLYRQPMFLNRAFGPYLPNASRIVDYDKVRCPNSEKVCAEQGAWLAQHLFLGSEDDVDDIARAFEKVYEHRESLNRWSGDPTH